MEQIIQFSGVELCLESFGDRADEPVLLLAGTSCSMDWWRPAFCERLARSGHFVIRFDQRDTGRSAYDPPGQPQYSLPDLVTDAFSALDQLGIESAHWVGFSQGGWVSQLAALDHPQRVRTLTLLSTRPTGHGPADADLPEVSESLLASWAAASGEPDWEDSEDVVNYLVDGERSISTMEFDEPHARAIAESCMRRARQIRSAITNHPLADQGPRWRDRLGTITAPCLVVHGTADPLFPIGNAEALAQEIPSAQLARLPGIGHELPPRTWDHIIGLISGHTHHTREQRRL